MCRALRSPAPIAAVAFCAACVGGDELVIPEAPPGGSILILALALDARPLPMRARLFASAPGVPVGAAVAFGPGTELYAFAMAEPLTLLQLEPGEVALRAEGRRLPEPVEARHARSAGGELSWEPASDGAAVLAGVRVEPIDGLACVDAGGCVVDLSNPRCVMPCPMSRPVAAPDPPEAPQLLLASCPGGEDGIAPAPGEPPFCEPPADCPAGQYAVPGEEGCVPLLAPCPAGEWADDLPSDRPVYYVRAGAVGGVGTDVGPFGSIAEALAGISGDDVVLALARGTYEEAVDLTRPVALWGACAAETVLDATAATALRVAEVPCAVRNLTIRAADRGVLVEEGGDLALTSVLITPGGQGIRAEGATLIARDLVIDDPSGSGVVARSGAVVELDRAIIRAAGGDGEEAFGISAFRSTVTATTVLIEHTTGHGINAEGSGAELSFARLVVRDSTRVSHTESVVGARVSAEAHVGLRDAIFARQDESAIQAVGPGTELVLERVVVRDARPRGPARDRPALETGASAYAELDDLLLEQVHDTGIATIDSAHVVALDVVIRELRDPEPPRLSAGWLVADARLDANRVHLRDAGARSAHSHESRTEMTSTLVEGGGGVSARGGIFSATRLVVRDVEGACLEDAGGLGSLHLSDVGLDGCPGGGLSVHQVEQVTVERLTITGALGFGVRFTVDDDVDRPEVVASLNELSIFAEPGATTISVGAGARADLEDFELSGPGTIGLDVADDSGATARRGTIQGHDTAIRAGPGVDVAALIQEVRFADNRVNVAVP